MDVLVIDVGGTHVKMQTSVHRETRRFRSGPGLTPEKLMARVVDLVSDWPYAVVSVGLPASVHANAPTDEPGNLGSGWTGFDFERAFARPVRVVNDAVMQALGAYDGGRMLFLGLGTGLGSALISDHVAVPLELGNLRLGEGEPLGTRLGRRGLASAGEESWRDAVTTAAVMLRDAFVADYVVLGGGNARRVQPLPDRVRRGGNADAFTGGFRLWEEEVEPHEQHFPPVWRVLR